MKFQLKTSLAVFLLSTATQVFASQVTCPHAYIIATNFNKIDAIQSLAYHHFALMTGTDLFQNSFDARGHC